MVKSCRRVEETKEDSQRTVSARGSDLRNHFKNTYETATAVKGMTLSNARQYLCDVLEHKRCVPFRKFTRHIGRTPQAKEFNQSQGRWPTKSVKCVLDLLQNCESNAAAKNIDVNNLYIWHVAVQRAMKGRRRTYRAHGRINPYMSNPCHVEVICKQLTTGVPKPDTDGDHKIIRLSRKENAARRLQLA